MGSGIIIPDKEACIYTVIYSDMKVMACRSVQCKDYLLPQVSKPQCHKDKKAGTPFETFREESIILEMIICSLVFSSKKHYPN